VEVEAMKKERDMAAIRVLLTLLIAFSGTLSARPNVWRRVGPEGGQVLRLTATPLMPSTLYALTCGGVFKTIDGGASWVLANSGLPAPDCTGSAPMDSDTAGTVYLVAGCDLFKTTDGGESWQATSRLEPPHCPISIAVGRGGPGTLYAGDNRLFKSTDGGSSWTQLSGFRLDDSALVLAVNPQNQEMVYAGGFQGLYKSIDGGASWTTAMSGLPAPLRIETLSIDPLNPDTVYAGGRGQLFKSTDAGSSWNLASLGLPPTPAAPPFPHQVLSLAISPRNPKTLYALLRNNTTADVQLVTSLDGGASWSTANGATLPAYDLNTLTPDPQDPDTLYLGSDNGVLQSTDGGAHWKAVNSGLRATGVASILIDPQNSGTLWAVNATIRRSHGTGLFKSTDNGKTWFPSDSGLPVFVHSLTAPAHDTRELYILGSHNGGGTGLFRSEDAGATWAEIWADSRVSTSIYPLAIDPQDSTIMYAGLSTCTGNCNSRIAKSTNAGYSWADSQISLKGTGCCSSVLTLIVDPQNRNTLYAGTGDDNETGSGLWKSMDGAVSWVNLGGGDIYAMAIDPRNSSTIYAAWNCCIYKSTDGGMTWAERRHGLPACCMFGPLEMDPQTPDKLYLAGYNAADNRDEVFMTNDGGANWTLLSGGLTGRVYSLTIDPRNPRTLYAGTSGGLFATTLPAPRPPVRRTAN
jgi:photosystem II stability/assembly factor-like uncharacterized protein